MENQFKDILIKEAKSINLCERMTAQILSGDVKRMARAWSIEPDWGLERQFPSLSFLEEHFNTQEIRDMGIFVSQNIDGLVMDEQVYILINCTGSATVRFSMKKAIFPMLYISQGSNIELVIDGSISPIELYDDSKVHVECINNGKAIIRENESV